MEPTDPKVIELREWSRLREDLTRKRTRLANRMREQLWRYYPQFLAAIDDDVRRVGTRPMATSADADRGAARSRGDARQSGNSTASRRIDAATLRGRLRAPAIRVAPGTAEPPPRTYGSSPRLALVNRQLAHARSQLDLLVRQFAEGPVPNASGKPPGPRG